MRSTGHLFKLYTTNVGVQSCTSQVAEEEPKVEDYAQHCDRAPAVGTVKAVFPMMEHVQQISEETMMTFESTMDFSKCEKAETVSRNVGFLACICHKRIAHLPMESYQQLTPHIVW